MSQDDSPNTSDDSTTAENSPSRYALQILRQRIRPSQRARAEPEKRLWLWHGYLGPGNITLLSSQWKTGKTTLVSILVSRMAAGGELAGLAVAAGSAAVFSEESREDWDERILGRGIGDQLNLFCRPFATKPSMAQWRGLIEAMLHLRLHEGLDLLVIDSLAVFLPPKSENNAEAMTECLLPLRELTSAGMSVLLVHHPRKGVSLPGQSFRGTGALASYVDIMIEMNWCGHPDDETDRRRWLRSFSRHDETRRHLIVERTADGTDCLARDKDSDERGADCAQVLRLVLEDAGERMTQRQILEQWPEDFRKPDLATISRALRRGMDQGDIRHQGTGRKHDPFRYWLPDKEDEFFPGAGASPEALRRFNIRHQEKLLKALGLDAIDGRIRVDGERAKKAIAQAAPAPPPAAGAHSVPEPPVAAAQPASLPERWTRSPPLPLLVRFCKSPQQKLHRLGRAQTSRCRQCQRRGK